MVHRNRAGEYAYQRSRRALRDQCRAEGVPCVHCGQAFDWSITNPRHPGYFTADHVVPVAAGGLVNPGREGLWPAHKGCNSSRGARPAVRQPSGEVGTACTALDHYSDDWGGKVRCAGCGGWTDPEPRTAAQRPQNGPGRVGGPPG